jgi:thymidylate synthase ThyX
MPVERQVYLLDPQALKPETIAVTFAKTSRSPESFREIAAELTDEKSAKFHEKWVVGYGHSSVAEHAVLHVAVENISRLAVESLESNRLASYTEKSTRYQTWGPDHFYIPAELDGHSLRDLYVETCRKLFQTYQEALPEVRKVIALTDPPQPGENDARWDRRVRSQYVDVCRFLLPAASLANVGMTINARALEHAIQKMLSDPLAEIRAMGTEIKQVAQAEVPTLVKYADAVPYLQNVAVDLNAQASRIQPATQSPEDWCRLVSSDPMAEVHILAAALYRYSIVGYAQCTDYVLRLDGAARCSLAESILGGRARHDIPIREIEHAIFTFDLLMDQGAYFEFKRHRMASQSAQPLTAHHGFALPASIVKAGLEDSFRQAMECARQAYDTIADAMNPSVAAYLVPNAFNRRVLVSLNLRSALHLISLRSAENAHFSIRRVALRMAEQIRACAPILGSYLPASAETWQSIESSFFAQV